MSFNDYAFITEQCNRCDGVSATKAQIIALEMLGHVTRCRATGDRGLNCNNRKFLWNVRYHTTPGHDQDEVQAFVDDWNRRAKQSA